MTTSSPNKTPIGALLNEWSLGNESVENQLIELLYPEIHRIAHFQVKSQSAHALQTTELVNEAFIKLKSQKSVDWQNKNHFLAIASKVIRRVVVDQYRSEYSQKRGGAEQHITLDSASSFMPNIEPSQFDWLELSDLIDALKDVDARAAEVVEYKVFGGMTIPEMAAAMSVSEPTVSRNWKFAKTWLLCHFK